ncbi:MAG: vWA domain-containing protein, partial [Planctomycetaceae bacterium]
MTARWLADWFPGSPGWREFWSTFEFGRQTDSPWFLILAGGVLLLSLLTGWLYRRDTRGLPWGWRLWLYSLRALSILGLLWVALSPQTRRSEEFTENSRVLLLVDTSVSMGRADSANSEGPATPGGPTRAEQVRQVLAQGPLLDTLRQQHEVSLWTFDSQVERPVVLPRSRPDAPPAPSADPAQPPVAPPNWAELLRPKGAESRLGEALLQAIREQSGETLSGIVVISDGQNNAGVDPGTVSDLAVNARTRVIPVGV